MFDIHEDGVISLPNVDRETALQFVARYYEPQGFIKVAVNNWQKLDAAGNVVSHVKLVHNRREALADRRHPSPCRRCR
jgi:hypothetical protein